jgi:hypothetical protein
MALELISQRYKWLDITSAADNLDDDVEAQAGGGGFGVDWRRFPGLSLRVHDGNQPGDCPAESGVQVQLDAAIMYA